MALCSGESHAIRVMRRTVSSQQHFIRQQRALLRRGNTQCSLDPNLAVAAAVGVDFPRFNFRDMHQLAVVSTSRYSLPRRHFIRWVDDILEHGFVA